MGIRGARRARRRLRSRMARSPLFFRSRWLGTFERAAKSKRTRKRSIAKQSHRTLSKNESAKLVDSGSAKFTDDLSVTTRAVFDALQTGGALFFTELVSRSGLLPSQVEDALSQLAALGLVTSDSFDGLRALLVPSNKRPTFGRNVAKRGRKTNLASIEFAGRWSLLRHEIRSQPSGNGAEDSARAAGIEKFARVLLRRYGVVFRRLLDRESFPVTWY